MVTKLLMLMVDIYIYIYFFIIIALDTFKKLVLFFSAINRRCDFNGAQTLPAIIKMGLMQEAKVCNILIHLSGI